MPEKFLLDTCALIWLAEGNAHISAATLEKLDKANAVYVSPISAWEISLKAERKELELPMPTETWFASVLKTHALTVYPLSPEILIAANRLPWHHRDPADRFIISSALTLNATVVTADQKFAHYDIKVII
jgi:PIN domain nuclease of toxin-antitoxin system